MPLVSSRIWTHVAVSISYNDNHYTTGTSLAYLHEEGKSFDVVVNMLDSDIIVSEFKLQLCFYIHFWTNTLGKGMNPFIPQLWLK